MTKSRRLIDHLPRSRAAAQKGLVAPDYQDLQAMRSLRNRVCGGEFRGRRSLL